jgi:serine protease AprX
MIKYGIVFIFLFNLITNTFAQEQNKYWIYFKDKGQEKNQIHPSEYLSAKAIERRNKQGINFDERDIPVSSAYINQVEEKGYKIIAVSRWFNAVSVSIDTPEKIGMLQSLDCIKNIVPVKKYYQQPIPEKGMSKFGTTEPFNFLKCNDPNRSLFDYGPSLNQIEMLNGVSLHAQGYTGTGVTIAVLDAGFKDVNILDVFDSLRSNNRILGTWDFVVGNDSVYEDNAHGTMVLSCMAALLPGQIVGTAPHASYWLLRTEDAATEYIQEEDFWVMGAEFADSAGADIINSSLGYTEYDNSADSHSYADLNGNTTTITKGADIAASKGILVINSAGNSGSSSWQYIGAPADGDSVLAIAAVDQNGMRAAFSSVGPSYDKRIKPNVAAQGQWAVVAALSGGIQVANGTSFSSPILAGMAACLWQSRTNATNMDVFRTIEKSAHQYNNPDSLLGFGIPNFELAVQLLANKELGDLSQDFVKVIYPNPFKEYPIIQLFSRYEQTIEIEVFDMQGKNVLKENVRFRAHGYCNHHVQEMSRLAAGQYFIKVNSNYLRDTFKVLKIE